MRAEAHLAARGGLARAASSPRSPRAGGPHARRCQPSVWSARAAHVPATPHDLARWWNGGGVSAARQWIAALGDEARRVDLDGTEAWMLATDVRRIREAPSARSVRLLPAFDQYVVGASWHALHLLPGDLRHRVHRPQGWISPVLLVNGRMEGVWRHDIRGSRVEVVVDPFRETPAWARRGAGQEAERLAAFLGGRLSFTWKR